MTEEDTKEVINKVINRIKEKRKAKGYSYENIANDLNISTSAYNKIERQETKLSLERMLQIGKILDLTLSQLFSINTETIYNQDFNDNSVYHQEVKNLYQDNRELTENYIESLKNEVEFLKSLLKKEK